MNHIRKDISWYFPLALHWALSEHRSLQVLYYEHKCKYKYRKRKLHILLMHLRDYCRMIRHILTQNDTSNVSVKGEYVRQWVPELRGIKGGDVHTPWTLSNSALSRAQVSLNETYPSPVIIAPEWTRHINKKSVRLLAT